MSEMRLYMDEDAGENAVVQGLRARGFDVLTTVESNQTGTSDPEQLSFANQAGRVLCTFNVADFARLHQEYLAQGKGHCGIVVIPDQRYSIGEKIRRLATLISSVSSEEMINRMEFI